MHSTHGPLPALGHWPIERIEARILDIPTIRPHKLAFGAISRQSPVIVQLWLADGACGFGDGGQDAGEVAAERQQ